MDKLFQLAKDIIADFYRQGVDSVASWAWRAIAVVFASINGLLIKSWIPERLLKDTQPTEVITNVSIIAWGWGVPSFVVVAFFCGAFLRWVASSTHGVPHAEIQGLRRLYFLLHVVSTVIVTCGLAFFLAGVLRDPAGGLPVGFWITLAAVAVSYSIVFVFIAAWLLPRPVRIATAYAMLRAPLAAMGF